MVLNSNLSDKENETRKNMKETRETKFLIHFEGVASLLRGETRDPLRELRATKKGPEKTNLCGVSHSTF